MAKAKDVAKVWAIATAIGSIGYVVAYPTTLSLRFPYPVLFMLGGGAGVAFIAAVIGTMAVFSERRSADPSWPIRVTAIGATICSVVVVWSTFNYG